MSHTPVMFHTNIDCCKKFMSNISGLPLDAINPVVGDQVRVYHDTGFTLYLKVVARQWTMINGANPVLTCELHLPDHFRTISDLERVLRNKGL